MNTQQAKDYFNEIKNDIYKCKSKESVNVMIELERINLEVISKKYPDIYDRIMACVRNVRNVL